MSERFRFWTCRECGTAEDIGPDTHRCPGCGVPIPPPEEQSCPLCTTYKGHAANCPTQLQTPEQRIERAAHLFECFDSAEANKICRADGLTTDEIRAGGLLSLERRRQRVINLAGRGTPEYGQL